METTRQRQVNRHERRQGWEPVQPDSTLIAWGGHRDADGIRQARLYRTSDGRFVVYEQHHDVHVVPTDDPRVTCRELDQDAARACYADLGVHTLPETLAFD